MFLRMILLSGVLLGGLLSNSNKVNNSAANPIGKTIVIKDTIKRNDFIVYNVVRDTLVAGMNIAVRNQNIEGKYIVQYFNLDRNTVIANYYPEMLSNIKILKNGKLWFDQSFLKKNMPESPLDRYKSKAVLKEITFREYIPEEKAYIFTAIAHVPNTDFEYEYQITVLLNGKYTIRHIGEAGD